MRTGLLRISVCALPLIVSPAIAGNHLESIRTIRDVHGRAIYLTDLTAKGPMRRASLSCRSCVQPNSTQASGETAGLEEMIALIDEKGHDSVTDRTTIGDARSSSRGRQSHDPQRLRA